MKQYDNFDDLLDDFQQKIDNYWQSYYEAELQKKTAIPAGPLDITKHLSGAQREPSAADVALENFKHCELELNEIIAILDTETYGHIKINLGSSMEELNRQISKLEDDDEKSSRIKRLLTVMIYRKHYAETKYRVAVCNEIVKKIRDVQENDSGIALQNNLATLARDWLRAVEDLLKTAPSGIIAAKNKEWILHVFGNGNNVVANEMPLPLMLNIAPDAAFKNGDELLFRKIYLQYVELIKQAFSNSDKKPSEDLRVDLLNEISHYLNMINEKFFSRQLINNFAEMTNEQMLLLKVKYQVDTSLDPIVYTRILELIEATRIIKFGTKKLWINSDNIKSEDRYHLACDKLLNNTDDSKVAELTMAWDQALNEYIEDWNQAKDAIYSNNYQPGPTYLNEYHNILVANSRLKARKNLLALNATMLAKIQNGAQAEQQSFRMIAEYFKLAKNSNSNPSLHSNSLDVFYKEAVLRLEGVAKAPPRNATLEDVLRLKAEYENNVTLDISQFRRQIEMLHEISHIMIPDKDDAQHLDIYQKFQTSLDIVRLTNDFLRCLDEGLASQNKQQSNDNVALIDLNGTEYQISFPYSEYDEVYNDLKAMVGTLPKREQINVPSLTELYNSTQNNNSTQNRYAQRIIYHIVKSKFANDIDGIKLIENIERGQAVQQKSPTEPVYIPPVNAKDTTTSRNTGGQGQMPLDIEQPLNTKKNNANTNTGATPLSGVGAGFISINNTQGGSDINSSQATDKLKAEIIAGLKKYLKAKSDYQENDEQGYSTMIANKFTDKNGHNIKTYRYANRQNNVNLAFDLLKELQKPDANIENIKNKHLGWTIMPGTHQALKPAMKGQSSHSHYVHSDELNKILSKLKKLSSAEKAASKKKRI